MDSVLFSVICLSGAIFFLIRNANTLRHRPDSVRIKHGCFVSSASESIGAWSPFLHPFSGRAEMTTPHRVNTRPETIQAFTVSSKKSRPTSARIRIWLTAINDA